MVRSGMVLQRPLEGTRVLVVDDQADALEAVCMFIELHGATVHCVDTAARALADVERFRPDVLLCDITMPGMDGYELVRRIREGSFADVPAIAYSGLSEPEDRERAFAAGFQRYLTKPLDTQKLVDTIGVLARQRGLARTGRPSPPTPPPEAVAPSSLPSLAGLRVSVVEDDTDTRDVVGVLLVRHGATVTAFASVSEALQGLTRSRPHVVITDVAMPEADGTELLRRIRQRAPEDFGEVPVIALTAYGKQYKGAGFDAVLHKPPQPDLLVKLVYAAVRPVEVVLYVSEGETSSLAAENLGHLLARFDPLSLLCRVVDVRIDADEAVRDRVVVTPALVRHHPRPVARLHGDLHDLEDAAATLESWGARERHR
jgi:CheY-like chemotaxis protein